MNKTDFFITGTDTGIGKTLVSCALIHALRQKGRSAIGMKPIAAGAENTPPGLRNEDALALINASNTDIDYRLINPICYKPAIAPHIAAHILKEKITTRPILSAYHQLKQHADTVIIEGAGGWFVPMNENSTLADLVIELELPVILVVGIRLGCLNHALLSQCAIQQAGVKFSGWVANIIDSQMPHIEENISYLENHLAAPRLATIPHQETPDYQFSSQFIDLNKIIH